MKTGAPPMQVIPAIDLKAGRCVRLYQGDFAAETRYARSPRELLQTYQSMGASWIHVVDLEGARDGIWVNRDAILELAAAPAIRLQVGGGIRTARAAAQLLAGGIDRLVIGSAAVESPSEVASWIDCFGAGRICLALDVRIDPAGQPRVSARGWRADTDLTLWQALARYPRGMVQHVLCTDIARDGALAGPNLELYREAVERFPDIAWQASGGVRDAADLHALSSIGVAAAITGKALLEQRIAATELLPFWRDASSPA